MGKEQTAAVEGYYMLCAFMSVRMHTGACASPHIVQFSYPLATLTINDSVG